MTTQIPFALAGTPVFSARPSANGYEMLGPVSWSAGRDQVFARWHWDGERLVVENDRWGIQPIFWAATSSAVHVSPSLDALLDAGASAAIDEGAMAVFLRTGYFVGEDTPFAAIRTLPAAACLTWTREGVRVMLQPRPRRTETLSRGDAAAQFAQLFTASVERCSADKAPSAVLLGGGHDSRHILLALDDLDRRPARCVTVQSHPPGAVDEVRVARQVAETLGVKHTVVARRSDRVESQIEAQALTHCCADELARFLPLRGYLEHLQFHAYDGLAGDVLSQSRPLDRALHRLFADGRVSDVASQVLGDPATMEPALERLLARDAMERFARYKAVARVAAEAERHTGAPNPIASFFFETRLRRENALAPYGILGGCRVSTPFLDAALVDFLLSLPFDAVADGRLHADTLRQHYPAVAHIPFDGKRHGPDDRRAVRRDAAALLKAVSEARSTIVHRSAVAARILKAVASGASRHLWFMPRLIHLLEVERRTRGERVTQAGADATTRAA